MTQPELRRFQTAIFTWLALFVLDLFFLSSGTAHASPHFQAITIPGKTLEDNPLGDPVERRVAVFTPKLPRFTSKLLTVYYLPGYGGSSEDFLGPNGDEFAASFQQMADAGMPLRMVVPDCRTHWGGSQYLNLEPTWTGASAPNKPRSISTAFPTS